MTRARLLVAAALGVVVASALACPGTRGAGRGRSGPPRLGERPAPPVVVDDKGRPLPNQPEAPPPLEIVREERKVVVELKAGTPAAEPVDGGPAGASTGTEPITASLGAVLIKPKDLKGPTIIVVPGGGDISRNGTRGGDGVVNYTKPAAVGIDWAEAFARRGAHVLLYDKRTCGPNDDPLCAKNPQDDIDAEGPVAMAKDVDAACALVRAEPDFDGRIVLMAHGQAAQVALSSKCASEATGLVLIAPIPRAIDEVMVAALKDRADDAEKRARAEKDAALKEQLTGDADKLKNAMGKAEAEFSAIKKDKFVATAKVKGATIAFWKGWMDLTGRTAALVDTVKTPKIVALGELDQQYGDKDRVRIRALAPDAFIEVKGADHHLLTGGQLAESTVDVVGAALDKVLIPAES